MAGADLLDALRAAPSGGRLDLHKESSDPGHAKAREHGAFARSNHSRVEQERECNESGQRGVLGCTRWPAHMRLLNEQTGELIEGRCNSTNLCAYCAKLAAVVNAEMATIDALNGAPPPTIFVVLTTRTATLDMSGFYESRRQVFKALRRRWPEVQIATVLEFTTGSGSRSGGARRPHWNLLLKNVPVDDLEAVREVVSRVWCSREDALPQAQHVQRVHAIEGLAKYLMLHFQKYSQAPPPGFRGHRFTHTRGYFEAGTAATRESAKRSLAVKRALWRARQRGLDAEAAEAAAAAEMARNDAATWRLYDLEAVVLAARRREARPRQPAPRKPVAGAPGGGARLPQAGDSLQRHGSPPAARSLADEGRLSPSASGSAAQSRSLIPPAGGSNSPQTDKRCRSAPQFCSPSLAENVRPGWQDG